MGATLKGGGASLGSQTKLNAMQSPRSPAMDKKHNHADDTEVQIGNAESSQEGYLLEGESLHGNG